MYYIVNGQMVYAAKHYKTFFKGTSIKFTRYVISDGFKAP